MEILGIDIGGSGIKGAIVDVGQGEMLTERFRIATPKSAKPKPVAKTVAGGLRGVGVNTYLMRV
ncbi:MAG: hypothetical protein U9Q82_15205, partial [Chloroflexota bacterium]|nr:hypothetical protein [Chloroflexota bacterium]